MSAKLSPGARKLIERIEARAAAEADTRVELARLDPLRLRQDRDDLLRLVRQLVS